MKSKTVIMDSSSAILLCKADLHTRLVRMYDIVIPASVYLEITARPYPGAHEFQTFAAEDMVHIADKTDQGRAYGPAGLDPGESDVIRLFGQGLGDFIMTDDGPAARYCRKAGIPFINALLFPVVLRCTGRMSDESCRRAMDRIEKTGRYSREVLKFARRCTPTDLAFALE